MYKEDRGASRRLGGSSANGGEGGPSGEGGLLARHRPALTEKQCSEPNSPVSRTFEPPAPVAAPLVPYKRPMNRGYSDLGSRFMKKKVIVKTASSSRNGDSPRDDEVVIVVPDREVTPPRLVTDSSEVCASCSAGAETEPRSVSSGSASWCEGDAAEERGYGSGDSLAEDAALLGDAAQASQPRVMRNQRRDVAVDLHLLRPDV